MADSLGHPAPMRALAALSILPDRPVNRAACTSRGAPWAHFHAGYALGYGLKYSTGFGFTHLGTIGRARPDP